MYKKDSNTSHTRPNMEMMKCCCCLSCWWGMSDRGCSKIPVVYMSWCSAQHLSLYNTNRIWLPDLRAMEEPC